MENYREVFNENLAFLKIEEDKAFGDMKDTDIKRYLIDIAKFKKPNISIYNGSIKDVSGKTKLKGLYKCEITFSNDTFNFSGLTFDKEPVKFSFKTSDIVDMINDSYNTKFNSKGKSILIELKNNKTIGIYR